MSFGNCSACVLTTKENNLFHRVVLCRPQVQKAYIVVMMKVEMMMVKVVMMMVKVVMMKLVMIMVNVVMAEEMMIVKMS